MQIINRIETERLVLRRWNQNDAEVFAAINQDEKVIEFLRGAMSLKDCQEFIAETNRRIEKFGFGLWAAEVKEAKELIGFVGLHIPDFESHFTPCVEIGFENFDLKEIVAITALQNFRSMKVMEKIGMKRDLSGDFNHPKLPLDHKLSRHALYKIT